MKKENKAIKIKIISYIRNLFELENKDYYKPVRVGNFTITTTWSMKVIVIQIKNLAIEEYLSSIKSSLKDIIFNLQKNLILRKLN